MSEIHVQPWAFCISKDCSYSSDVSATFSIRKRRKGESKEERAERRRGRAHHFGAILRNSALAQTDSPTPSMGLTTDDRAPTGSSIKLIKERRKRVATVLGGKPWYWVEARLFEVTSNIGVLRRLLACLIASSAMKPELWWWLIPSFSYRVATELHCYHLQLIGRSRRTD